MSSHVQLQSQSFKPNMAVQITSGNIKDTASNYCYKLGQGTSFKISYKGTKSPNSMSYKLRTQETIPSLDYFPSGPRWGALSKEYNQNSCISRLRLRKVFRHLSSWSAKTAASLAPLLSDGPNDSTTWTAISTSNFSLSDARVALIRNLEFARDERELAHSTNGSLVLRLDLLPRDALGSEVVTPWLLEPRFTPTTGDSSLKSPSMPALYMSSPTGEVTVCPRLCPPRLRGL